MILLCRRMACAGERDKLGRLRGGRHRVQCPAEAGVLAVTVAGELVVEEPGADLEQEVGVAGVSSTSGCGSQSCWLTVPGGRALGNLVSVVAQGAPDWLAERVRSSSDPGGSTGALAGGDPQISVTIVLMTGLLWYRPECASPLFCAAAKGSSCRMVACPGGAASGGTGGEDGQEGAIPAEGQRGGQHHRHDAHGQQPGRHEQIKKDDEDREAGARNVGQRGQHRGLSHEDDDSPEPQVGQPPVQQRADPTEKLSRGQASRRLVASGPDHEQVLWLDRGVNAFCPSSSPLLTWADVS